MAPFYNSTMKWRFLLVDYATEANLGPDFRGSENLKIEYFWFKDLKQTDDDFNHSTLDYHVINFNMDKSKPYG